jgi:single-strand DNA-binding protein
LSAAGEVQGRKKSCERRWNIIVSINKVILVGHLGKNPEVKYLASGAAVWRFSLATNETWKNKAGDVEKRTEWHSVVAFGRLGEVCGEWLTAGRLVYVEGSIRSNQWEDKSGNRRKSYDIVARQMRMLSPSNGNGTRPKESKPAQPSAHSDEDNPFSQDEGGDIPF